MTQEITQNIPYELQHRQRKQRTIPVSQKLWIGNDHGTNDEAVISHIG